MPSPLALPIALGLLLTAGPVSAQTSGRAPACEVQSAVDVKLITEQVIVIGEPHGTVEIPRFVGGLVCSLLADGRSVIVALERDGNEQQAFNRFIESDGGPDDVRALTSLNEWRSKCPDGRSSAAMLALIEQVRQLRQAGQRVALVALRQQYGLNIPMTAEDSVPLNPQDNALHNVIGDRAMADNLLSTAILYRRYTVVALAGSGHTSTVESAILGHKFQPMGKLISEATATFFIGFQSLGGKHWGFGARGCGERELEPGPLYSQGTRISAVVSLPETTVSPPALARQQQ